MHLSNKTWKELFSPKFLEFTFQQIMEKGIFPQSLLVFWNSSQLQRKFFAGSLTEKKISISLPSRGSWGYFDPNGQKQEVVEDSTSSLRLQLEFCCHEHHSPLLIFISLFLTLTSILLSLTFTRKRKWQNKGLSSGSLGMTWKPSKLGVSSFSPNHQISRVQATLSNINAH